MSRITTHILDTAKGCPASGVRVLLEQKKGADWFRISDGTTDLDGRVSDLTEGHDLEAGCFKLTFELDSYFSPQGRNSFYPEASIVFNTTDKDHYHVPLLLTDFGYTTYRGS